MRFLHAAAAVLLTLAALTGVAAAGDVAIIVSRDNPTEALTMAELSRIFRMDQQHWRSGGRIDVVLQMSGSEKDAIVTRSGTWISCSSTIPSRR
jgi:ABC-type phosphate transport system substrate-binding protein